MLIRPFFQIKTKLAEIAYERQPSYDRWTEGQPRTWEETEPVILKHDSKDVALEKGKGADKVKAAMEALINTY